MRAIGSPWHTPTSPEFQRTVARAVSRPCESGEKCSVDTQRLSDQGCIPSPSTWWAGLPRGQVGWKGSGQAHTGQEIAECNGSYQCKCSKVPQGAADTHVEELDTCELGAWMEGGFMAKWPCCEHP